jgi:hypothetical protein
MNINRHNYEEFFILYMDNELNSGDRRLVEAFVQNHPDLKDELDILLQYKLEPDTTITYTGKKELLMPLAGEIKEQGVISTANYEEWLILYADKELTADQQIQVEAFITLNPAVKKELNWLQQSKLQPDETIVFAHKEILYRKEEKVRPLPRWWRLAAAAVLLLATGLTLLSIIRNRNTEVAEEIAGNGKQQTLPAKLNVPDPVTNPMALVKEPNGNIVAPVTNSSAGSVGKQQTPAGSRYVVNPVYTNNDIRVREKNTPAIEPPAFKKNELVIAEQNKLSNNLPTPVQNPNVNNIPKDAIAKVTPFENKDAADPLTNLVVTNQTSSPSGIRTAVNKEPVSDTDADLGNSGKKNKLRGFLRKVTRTFEKRTNIDATNGDDRLLVAGLSFKLK